MSTSSYPPENESSESSSSNKFLNILEKLIFTNFNFILNI